MSGYIEQLERELTRAGREHQRRPAGWRPLVGALRPERHAPGGGRGVLVAIASTATTVAVVVLAIALLGHRQASTKRPTAVPPSAQQLVSMLAVLRRPQTPADRAIPASDRRFIEQNVGPIVAGLTRRVATIGTTRIFMFVVKPSTTAFETRQGPLWSPALGDRIFVGDVSTSSPGQPVPAVELRDPYISSSWYVTQSQKQYLLGIAPDGVARVRVLFPNRAIYASVTNNTYVALAPPASNERVRSITWYGSNGRVIPTTTEASDTAMSKAIAARKAATRASIIEEAAKIPNRAPPALLHSFAVFTTGGEHPVTAAGITISRPSLSSFPILLLQFVDNPRAVRAVSTQSGLRFWADPGPLYVTEANHRLRELTQVCLRQAGREFAAACRLGLEPVLAEGLWAGARVRNGAAVIYGIVPDTNRTVTLRLRGGATRTVPVVNGVVVTPANGVTAMLVRGVDGTVATVPAPKIADR